MIYKYLIKFIPFTNVPWKKGVFKWVHSAMICWKEYLQNYKCFMNEIREYHLKKIWWKHIGFKFIKITQSSASTPCLERLHMFSLASWVSWASVNKLRIKHMKFLIHNFSALLDQNVDKDFAMCLEFNSLITVSWNARHFFLMRIHQKYFTNYPKKVQLTTCFFSMLENMTVMKTTGSNLQ